MNAGFDQRFAPSFCAIRAFSRARPIFELCALKKKKGAGGKPQVVDIFLGRVHAPSGLRIWRSRRRGAGGSEPRPPPRRPSRGPWEPRTRPQTRLRWKDGRDTGQFFARARRLANSQKIPKSRPQKSPARERIVEARTAPRARPGAQPGAHAGLRIDIFLVVLEDEERRVVFTPRSLGITGRLSPGASHRSAHLDHHPVLRGDVRGRDGDRGGTLQRLHPLLSHEVLHVRVMRRLKHRPGLIVVEVERVPALPPAVCDVQAQPTPLVTRHTVRVRAKKHPAPRESGKPAVQTGGSNRKNSNKGGRAVAGNSGS